LPTVARDGLKEELVLQLRGTWPVTALLDVAGPGCRAETPFNTKQGYLMRCILWCLQGSTVYAPGCWSVTFTASSGGMAVSGERPPQHILKRYLMYSDFVCQGQADMVRTWLAQASRSCSAQRQGLCPADANAANTSNIKIVMR
jgi:hypothetical protein